MKVIHKILPLTDIIAANSQVRTHSTKQIKKAVRLFQKQGIVSPIVITEQKTIIDGHLRVIAARKLGMSELNCLMLYNLNKAQHIELSLSLNRLSEDTIWDIGTLKSHLEFLTEFNLDLSFTGFEQAEIDTAFSFSIIEDEPVAFPSTLNEAVTRLGDVWQIGNHFIICGDSLNIQDDILALSSLPLAKLCLTDPPYNVPTKGHIQTKGTHEEFAMAAGEMSDTEFTDFLSKFIFAGLHLTTPNALFYICMDWRHISHLNEAAAQNALIPQNLCIWAKSNAGMGSFYRSQHELVGIYSKSTKFQNNINLGADGRYRTNVWNYAGVTSFGSHRQNDLAAHPTVKPTNMFADVILDCTSIGDTIFDPFLGSGTTCLAAQQTKRKCLGIEYKPKYVDAALQRLKERCGLEAVHLPSGHSFAEIRSQRAKGGSNA